MSREKILSLLIQLQNEVIELYEEAEKTGKLDVHGLMGLDNQRHTLMVKLAALPK